MDDFEKQGDTNLDWGGLNIQQLQKRSSWNCVFSGKKTPGIIYRRYMLKLWVWEEFYGDFTYLHTQVEYVLLGAFLYDQMVQSFTKEKLKQAWTNLAWGSF